MSLDTFSVGEATSILSRTPATLDALLRGLPEAWTRCKEGANTWSAFDIVGHLASAEQTNWMPRILFVLEDRGSSVFPSFDRFAHLARDLNASLEQRLDEFASLRSENLAKLDALALKEEDLAQRGNHPALGSVALSELIGTWAVHDLNHLHQLSRVMANRYRDVVGPWSAYLGVLKCAGHSEP